MRKSQFLMGCALATGLATCATSAMAQDFSYKGSITSDLRFTVPGQDMPGDVDKVRFDRTDNTFRFTGAFTWGVVEGVAVRVGIAAVGIMIGVVTSNGMMEVARNGVFHPGMFTFAEIMTLFVGIMLTDVILYVYYKLQTHHTLLFQTPPYIF